MGTEMDKNEFLESNLSKYTAKLNLNFRQISENNITPHMSAS